MLTVFVGQTEVLSHATVRYLEVLWYVAASVEINCSCFLTCEKVRSTEATISFFLAILKDDFIRNLEELLR